MKGLALNKDVIIALHAHGVPVEKIAQYMMRDLLVKVTSEVSSVVSSISKAEDPK